MTKIRVHEYAKQVNKTSKEVIEALSKLNVSVTNHMSMLEKDAVAKLNQTFKATPEKNVAKQSTQNMAQKPQSNGQQKPQHSVKKQEGQRQQSATSKPKVNNQQHAQQNSNSSNEKSKNTKGNQNRNMTQNNNNNNNNRRGGGGYNQRPKPGIHGGKRRHPKTHQPSIPVKQKELPEKITFVESLSVAELAKKLHREPSEIIKKLFMLGVMATINQELDKDAIELICADYGVEVEEEIRVDITDLETHFEQTEEVNEADLSERPPVVTIMGHVDHGKTTLLDSIRHTKVTAGEAGGITQHIGAYQVTEGDKKITFLDTPGHAAFTTMGARGAKVTDLTILVVAADDGVMPQTVEAINHAKAAEVPIIVAVNKMDKPSANPDRVMQELTEHGLVPEAWGGDTIFVPISALKGEGIDTLLEMILLVAEVGELKANPERLALGTVIEAQLDKGRGSVATLLVQDGTLKVGDPIVVGHTYGRVRAMVNDKGRRVKEAGPSTPVEITGSSR